MTITETYKNNIKAIEKFLCTFNFAKESEDRIRKYLENPLDVLNDNIKELFKKYDDQVVDFRIPLPTSMIKERKTTQKEIYLIMSLIVDCLEEDDQFKYTVDETDKIYDTSSLVGTSKACVTTTPVNGWIRMTIDFDLLMTETLTDKTSDGYLGFSMAKVQTMYFDNMDVSVASV